MASFKAMQDLIFWSRTSNFIHGNAVSSHSGFISWKTAYNKRGELLWAIASKKNFINLHSAAFFTVFGRNLVHAYKFRISKKKPFKVIPLKLFHFQTFFETWHNQHS